MNSYPSACTRVILVGTDRLMLRRLYRDTAVTSNGTAVIGLLKKGWCGDTGPAGCGRDRGFSLAEGMVS